MKLKQVAITNQIFLELFEVDQGEAKSNFAFYKDKEFATSEFINQLVAEGRKLGLIYLTHHLNKAEFDELLENEIPILVFANTNEKINPVVIKQEKKKLIFFHKEHSLTASLSPDGQILSDLLKDGEAKILALTCIPSAEIGANHHSPSKNPVRSFLRLLSTEKRSIGYIYLYAIIGGIISLSLPLGIQSIINFISSGQISTSVIALIVFIILGVLISGGMQIMQLTIVEHIQQRLFAKIAFNIVSKLPKLKLEAILKYYPPELINRFFDILTVQKGISNILIDLTSAVLQIVFGLILLSLYHPSFIFFGIILIGVLYLIIYFTGSQGLETSLKESKYKYKLAYWLEEVARTLHTFKMAGNSNLAVERTDYYLAHYLKARKEHFKILFIQYFSFVGFKTLVTAGLLILGCILIVNQEINIGQFVASEIIIILIMNAVEKVISKFEKIYDILTSTSKLEQVTTLPEEHLVGYNIDLITNEQGLSIKATDLKYKYPENNNYSLQGIELEILPAQRVCLAGLNGSGKTTLINVLSGLLENYTGSIIYNGLSLKDINKASLHHLISNNLSEEEIIHTTILENITLGRKEIMMEEVISAIEFIGLQKFVGDLPDGLNTSIIGGNLRLPKNIVHKIILARSIVNRPRLLILDGALLGIEKSERINVLKELMNRKNNWTLIILSNDAEIMQMCDQIVVLQEGRKIFQGEYESIRHKAFFKNWINE